MGLWQLFVVALMPVVKVLLITAVGVFLATERMDILGTDARKHLNSLVFYVLNPALVGSNLAKFITLKSIVMLWFMPLNILITFIAGSALGWLLIKITKAPIHLRGLILGCCAAGNLGNMPLIIIPAACEEKGNPFGDASICKMHGLAYATLSLAIGSILLWSYVYNIVRIYSSTDSDETKPDALPEGIESAREITPGPMLFLKEPSIDEGMENFELDRAVSKGKAKVPFPENIKQGFQKVLKKLNLKRLLSPSINGAIVGFIAGTIPPFRKVLIGDSAPLRVVEDSAYFVGESAITITTLILGANLLKGFRGSKVPISVIIGITAVRYIILPILGVGFIKCAVHFGAVNSDPLYKFVLLLQFALPPAINIGTMTQLFGAGEAEYSVIMLWTYALASVSVMLWSAFFMWLVK
uniref:Auxin efflux carrier family protein n=2 Tax=Populus trichocarpa TaxID=3694 RepID=A0A3N7FRX9_POPTR|eukprot:XP_024436730.1 protein PIN-LIKES 3 [Populus trichocarpa]